MIYQKYTNQLVLWFYTVLKAQFEEKDTITIMLLIFVNQSILN